MTDMKKLTQGHEGAKPVQTLLSEEQMAEAAKLSPIDIDPVDMGTLTNLRRIRTHPGHLCLAYACDQGVLLRDRHSRIQYLLTREHLKDMIPIEEKQN